MVKTALDMLSSSPLYKKGILTGMLLAKQIADKKKMNGGGKVGVKFKKALAVLAGPLGWVWLAKNSNKEKIEKLQKKLKKYEPKKKTKTKKLPPPVYDDDEDDVDYEDGDDGGDNYGDYDEEMDDY